MPKISVIIPVHNTEKYLEKCLDSVINQTLKDIEIICVNDCSTDESLAILQEYAAKDKRIKLIDLGKNNGAAYTRNLGIDNAEGEYIAFLDSDDFVDLDFYEKLYKKARETNADAVKGNIYNCLEETNTTELTDFYNMNDKIRKNKAYFYYGFTSAIYKKSFLDEFNIRFPEGINYFEDPYFSIKACLNYKKLEFDDSAKYYYLQRKNSLSSEHLTQNKLNDLSKSISGLINLLNISNIKKTTYYIIYNFLYNYVEKNYQNGYLTNETKEFLYDIMVELFIGSKYQLKFPALMYKKFLENVADGKYYDLLLKYYKEYDRLNKNTTTVKILISYIKPSFLLKSDILTPIHLGRSVEKECSKDGVVTDDDIKWLHDNCIGDNDFEGNISHLNRRIGFFTGTYWAWKNYEKLGNPEYFGSMGYRKLLFPNCLGNINDYDFILPKKMTFNKSIKEQFVEIHGKNYYDVTLDVIKNCYKSEVKSVENYFNKTSGYFTEMYILKQSLFFDFCEWIFKLIEYLVKIYPNYIKQELEKSKIDVLLSDFSGKNICHLHDLELKNKDFRDIAFIIERLSGYYFYKLTLNKELKYKEITVFEPEIKPLSIIDCKKIILEQIRQNVKTSLLVRN